MDFKNQYKNPRPGFGDADHKRDLRAVRRNKSRKEDRSRAFNFNRDLRDVSASTSPQLENKAEIKDELMKKLIKWREDRDRKKKMEAAKKKPAFKVGVVHHSLCSPRIRTDKKLPQQAKRPNNVPKGITKATEKRLRAKAAAASTSIKQAPTTSKNTTLTSIKHSTNKMERKSTSAIKKSSSIKKHESFAPAGHKFRPPSGVKKMPLFGLVQIEPTPQEKGDFFIQEKLKECKTIDINEQQNATIDIDKEHNATIDIDTEHNATIDIDKEHNATINIDKEHNATFEIDKPKNSSLEKLNYNTPDRNDIKKGFRTSSPKEEDFIVFSPYLTLSRGKKNARKEQQQRLGIGRLSSNEIPTKDTVMQNLNISVEDEERTAQYFKFLLKKETLRLQELCQNWSKIRLENDVPDDAEYEINQAVGQTNLLITKKFERFRNLVQDCETGRGEMLVTCRDLQGFWDMMYMEVENCESRFKKLEERQSRGWQEEEHTTIKPIAKKRVLPKKQTVSSKPSSLRSIILAARKKKIEAGTANKEDLLLQDEDINEKHITSSGKKSITFKDVNTRHSTRRSKSHDVKEHNKSTPVRRESSRVSLVKAQFSDTSKRMKSPYTVMKISQMCKTPEVQLDDTISYVNSDQTPGKSILKKSEELINKETRIKSAHKVNFDDEVFSLDVPLDEETQVKLNLSAALNRIDGLDLNEASPQENIDAVKQLKFESFSENIEDFSENEMGAAEAEIKKKRNRSKSSIQNMTDFKEHLFDISSESVKKLWDDIRTINQGLENPIEDRNISNTPPSINIWSATPIASEDNTEVRVLRNRTITATDTPKTNRRSKMTPKNVSKKENKSPTKSHKKSLAKLSQKDGNKSMTRDKDDITEIQDNILTENVDKRRKSSRKSVAFNPEDCLVCSETKPVLPMTPHLKKHRNKTSFRQSRGRHISDEDLISWTTPERIPNRITRSQGLRDTKN
ncbi:disks large-associated protein 5 isoform X2 [Linepithema humile]|uniref:disks large-associated protein 5 isoform X2 n=1 Tax=Linepithema humile TaxID=83485 RepID=UPI000623A8C7|nr:PREDICTED: disks large-associated protein 5 isoform X2 [Linepithema humile]